MKYKAVIFDLFGTLVPSFTEREYRGILRQMAGILDVPPPAFEVAWSETFSESVLGIIPGIKEKVILTGRQMGSEFARDKAAAAADLMNGYSARCMQPRTGAPEVLSQIKQKGLKTGLVSDCTPDAPELWKKTVLAPLVDVTVFSCLVGLRKPDPRIYRLAIGQLAVDPAECLYVGDGASRELTGALEVGLRPIQLYIASEKDAFRVEKESWKGKVITSLNEVLDLLEGP
jgi:putative hydrolase of the HAD superfamily